MHAAAEKRGRKRWGAGCFTLALLVGLGGIGLFASIVYEARRPVRPTPFDLAQAVPPYEASRQGPNVVESGRVVLDIEGIDLSVEPGPPGSPIRVEGAIDTDGFDVTPEYSAQGESGWTYKLQARPSRFLGRLVRRGGRDNSIRITLPGAIPIRLEGVVANEDTRIELGGLWIVETNLEFSAGEQRIAFSQPLLQPMARFAVKAPLGELTLVELGNASPRSVRIDKNVGEVCLDLAGAWKADTTVEVACGVGSCDLHRPASDEAVVKVAGADWPDSDLPVIDVRATGVLSDNVEVSQQLPKPANSP